MKELPVRFVCHSCGVCVATSDGLLESTDNILVFSRLHAPFDEGQGNKSLICPCCESGLGIRTGSTFELRRDRVVKRQDRLEILVCSLKESEIADVRKVLQEVFPHSNVSSRILQKSELRGFQLSSKPSFDFVVVVHRNEGRVLLTDRNGFYHDVIGSAWQLTQGNVLVVLTRTEQKGKHAELYDGQLLRSLSTQGDQPTIGAISACGRVLTWETSPNKPQLEQLQALTAKAYFREPLVVAQGIPVQWTRSPPKSQAQSAWCQLL